MDTRISRLRSSSSIQSRSDSEKRSISLSPRQEPSSPVLTNESDDEQDLSTTENKLQTNEHESSSTLMSDIEDEQEKKQRSHRHRHHRHHHHHQKQSKSNKRPATYEKHSVKRSKKEPISTKHEQQSDDEVNSINSAEKISSQSEQSQSEKEMISNDEEEEEEEGVIQGNNTPDERRHRRRHHRKKQRRSSSSSSNDEPTSPTNQSSTSIQIPKNNKGTQLIVNYLPASLRESDFYQLFARIAPVKLCKLITDRQTGHSFCYGFIEYHSKEDALKAIDKFNGYKIEHKKLKVSYAQPKSNVNDDNEINAKHSNSSSSQKNSNIYITDLPENFDEKTLERLFSKYGEIVQTKILRDPRTKISRGVGFVLMTSIRYAERAVKALDGYVPSGTTTPISVKYADPKKTTNANDGNYSPSRLSRSSSMVGSTGPYGYPPGLPSMNMIDPYYASTLHRHHRHHHRAAMNMRDLSPSPPPPPPPPPPPSFYGTSRSSRIRSPSPGLPRSYSSKHSSNLSNSSSRSSSNRNTATSLAAAYDLIAKGCQQAIDPNGFVIYAFGLPNDCDENDLNELFRRYGDVHRVYIVRNYSTGESKGYSFITMSNYDEACQAVTRLDGSTFQGRTIQVRFKQ